MNCAEVSDLEEGEILEYDLVSPCYSKDIIGISKCTLGTSIKENKNGCFELKEDQDICLPEHGKDGYINERLKEKLKLKEELRHNNSGISMLDLESISSEGEYKSDEDDKYSAGDNEYYTCSNGEMKKREKHPTHFYGTVEDIMSEIGETICRKSRCNYKKRKSKELKQNLGKYSKSTYDLWRRQIFSSHLKSKNHKKKETFVDSDSDLEKYKAEKRKKRKKREIRYDEEETTVKKLKLRDFDEMRRNLLEKLKKQKAEEKLKESTRESPLVLENSDIQEIDMLIDCTNYVDNPPITVPGVSTKDGRRLEEKQGEGEDELDLIKLRLIALASNKKRKGEEGPPKTEESEKRANCAKEETDLDRHELLLRAEALKTALLKKHQRRLNRLKVEKPIQIPDSNITDVGIPLSHPGDENVKDRNSEKSNENYDADACKENLERENENGADGFSDVPPANPSLLEGEKKGTALLSSGSSKKTPSRTKSKRKKRKSVSFANNLKENNEITDALEEDDRTLRTRLLSDLMKKKSLRDPEKKSVLGDSFQAAVMKKPSRSVINAEPPKESATPLPAVKPNLLKKINVPKTPKPVAAPVFPKPEIQRIIVHLGSEDSSDEDGTPPFEARPALQEREEVGNEGSAILKSDADKRVGEGIQANYERSVELLLSQTRKKIEGEKRTAPTTLATPEAVFKHLPPSQRLEYMRLKQKIAERESLRKQKKENPRNSLFASFGPQPLEVSAASGKESVGSAPQKPGFGKVVRDHSKRLNLSSDKNSLRSSRGSKPDVVGDPPSNSNDVRGSTGPDGRKPNEIGPRLVINKMKNNLTGFSEKSLSKVVVPPENGLRVGASTERNVLLLPSSQALISKLKLLLKKIRIEKTIEENYEKEISKLRNQLSLFEKRKCEQRFKIKKLWEESMKTYKAIQGLTAKSNEKATLGEKQEKEETKKPEGDLGPKEEGKEPEKEERMPVEKEGEEEGKKVSDEPDTEISKAQSKSDKELNTDDNISEAVAEGTSSFPCFAKYDSPLQVFKKLSDSSNRVDPNVMVCQFDLMGVCKDEECAYQHLRILAK